MEATKQQKFILAIGLQIVIILGIILFKVAVLTGGTNILLKIQPVDPRDPLRGDYVTFRYSISNIPAYQFSYAKIKNGDTVYVPLQRSGKLWNVNYNVSQQKPTTSVLFLKGKVTGLPVEGLDLSKSDAYSDRTSPVHVIYGIEQYFIPEGTGRNVSFTGENYFAKVAVDQDGNAVLKQIYINGNLWP